MTIFHDEVEIEDFEYDEDDEMYYYPCPCGDRFQISKEELIAGEEVATCPSCSLVVKVIYDMVDPIVKVDHNDGLNHTPFCLSTGQADNPVLQEKFKAESEEVIKEDGDKETVKA